jgi:hypothetical protein
MGLEAINLLFKSKEPIELFFTSKIEVMHHQGKKYSYVKDDEYWIDLEIQDNNSLSIRIALCNPNRSVLMALFSLLASLFRLKESMLIEMNTKQVFKELDDKTKEALEKLYLERKNVFQSMYGSYTAAISSEEFYRRVREG